METTRFCWALILCLALISQARSQEQEDQQPSEEDLSTDTQARCAFECDKGIPIQNPGYKPSFNGCGSYGVNVDFKKCPYLTDCCNHHDVCYDICGNSRDDCDEDFKTCTHNPSEVLSKNTRGLCSSYGSVMYYTVRIAGCPAFKNAQENACICSVKV